MNYIYKFILYNVLIIYNYLFIIYYLFIYLFFNEFINILIN